PKICLPSAPPKIFFATFLIRQWGRINYYKYSYKSNSLINHYKNYVSKKVMDRENNSLQEKHQFRSYYCEECKQTKPCRVLTSRDYCCFCYYQIEQEKSQAYLDFQPVYQQELKEQQVRFQQLELL